MKKVTLSKKIGWIIVFLITVIDMMVTYSSGGEANPIWGLFVSMIGFNLASLSLGPIVSLALFYLIVKAGGWLIRKIDKYPEGEEIVLTGLALALVTWEVYVIFFRPFFGYLGGYSPYRVIPLLIIPLVFYVFWVDWQKKRK